MSFAHYRIVLQLLSPLHIGKRKYGNLMETREYVPGRTLWGALTGRITRDYFGGAPNKYEEIGEELNKNLRFGYLWPGLKKLENEKDKKNSSEEFDVYFPWRISDKNSNKEERSEGQNSDLNRSIKFIYKFISPDDFDYLFKFGYMGQPLDYAQKSTEEGQLHEVEFIGAKTRDDRQVYLIGDLWIKNEFLANKDNGEVKIFSKTVQLKRVFNSLQVGGERGYGWGRVKVEKFEKIENASALGGAEVEYSQNEVILKFKKDQRITAHALAARWVLDNDKKEILESVEEGKIEGPIEPLTGYQLRKNNEWFVANPPVCYVPGSKITTGSSDSGNSTNDKIDLIVSSRWGILTKTRQIDSR